MYIFEKILLERDIFLEKSLWKAQHWLKIFAEKPEKLLNQEKKHIIINSHMESMILHHWCATVMSDADTKKNKKVIWKWNLGFKPEMHSSQPMKSKLSQWIRLWHWVQFNTKQKNWRMGDILEKLYRETEDVSTSTLAILFFLKCLMI